MENERRAKYLLIDEQGLTKYGIEKGYYPDLNTEFKNGELKIADHDEAIALRNQNAIESIEDNGYYMLNPYSKELRYELASSSSANLELLYVNCEMEAVRHILQMMGAKSIKLEKVETSTCHQNQSGEGGIDAWKFKARVTGGRDEAMMNTISQIVTYNNPQNKVRPLDEIKRELDRTGLSKNPFLVNCLNDLKDTNEPMKGTNYMKFQCLSEVKEGFELGAKLKVFKIKGDFDYQKRSEETHEFTTTLEVNFG